MQSNDDSKHLLQALERIEKNTADKMSNILEAVERIKDSITSLNSIAGGISNRMMATAMSQLAFEDTLEYHPHTFGLQRGDALVAPTPVKTDTVIPPNRVDSLEEPQDDTDMDKLYMKIQRIKKATASDGNTNSYDNSTDRPQARDDRRQAETVQAC